MKVSLAFSALAAVVNAHYTFPALIANGTTGVEWSAVCQWTGYQSDGPVTDVSSLSIRCNVGASTKSATQTASVAAGSAVEFTAKADIWHPGPMLFNMAKVPAGQTAATWDGAGEGATSRSVKLPVSLPSGEYLIRAEHIAPYSAQISGGAQFYISCGQLNITGGGAGTRGPLAEFPGAYKAADPGIMINIYYPVPTTYIQPGPAIWKG
ncbi:hypothetical protein BDZ45DRAFT_696737 [Acephala macrosclerotiorum]|nr:hypothetical protein BDZ45DRAFT_696737 [Acephala macrosclerotiorum]